MPIYKRKNAPYLVKVNYTDRFGATKQVVRQNQFTVTYADARKVEADLLQTYCSGRTPQVASTMTMEKLIADYFENYATDETRSSTQRHTESGIRLYIDPFFKDLNIFDIDAAICQNWKKWVQRQKNRKNGKDLSNEYKKEIYKHLNKLFNYAVKMYNLPFNPLDRIGPFKNVHEIIEDINYLTEEEFDKFIAMFRDFCEHQDGKTLDDLRYWGYYVFFNILYFCGTRKGEAYCLTWDGDLKDFNKIVKKNDKWFFRIRHSMNQKVKGKPFEIGPPKNKKSNRDIPICDRLIAILEEHRKRYDNVYGFSKDWFICGGIDPLWDTTLANYKNEIIEEAELPQIRIHDFRHSFASMLINAGIPIEVVSKWMGHATIRETQERYGHLYPVKEDEALTYLNAKNAQKQPV